MTPEQTRLVEQSAAEFLERPDLWSLAFYDHLFADHPEVRSMFPDDLTLLRAKFVAEIGALLQLIGDYDAFEARAGRLGVDHVGFGVRAAHYRASSAALVASVQDVLGDGATPELLAAWQTVHDLVAEAMLSGGTRVPIV